MKKKAYFALTFLLLLSAGFIWRSRARVSGEREVPVATQTRSADSKDSPTAVSLRRIREQFVGKRSGVRGRVVNADRRGVAMVQVIFVSPLEEVVTESGPDGEFAVELRPGAYSARAVGERVVGAMGPGFRVTSDHAPQDLEIQVQELAVVRGRVVDSKDQPVVGATVDYVAADKGRQSLVEHGYFQSTTLSDAAGWFELQVLANGAAVIEAREGLLKGHAEVPDMAPGDSKDGLVVRIPAGATLRGKVLGPNGEAIAQAPIHVVVSAGATTVTQDVLTDDGGRFVTRPIAPGNAVVEAVAPGLSRTTENLVLAAGSTVDMTLTLPMSRNISGIVTNEAGQPLPGARVRAGRGNSKWRVAEVMADEQGRFVLEGLGDSAYWVGAQIPGLAAATVTNIVPPASDLTLVIAPKGGLKGSVLSQDGKPIQTFHVTVERFSPRGASPREDGTVTRYSSPSGTFELPEQTPGTYELVVSADGFRETRLAAVAVPPGGWAEVSATLVATTHQ